MRHVPRSKVRTLAAVALATAALAFRANPQEPPAVGVDEGNLYPDFILPTVDGDMLQLSDYRGKKVLLFHFASW